MNQPLIKLSRQLVFASASEARRKILADLGIKFIPDAVEIDESPLPRESVSNYVKRLAREKAAAAIPPSLDAIIATVDTAIGLDEKIIGKPQDEADARSILRQLSGRTHVVASAIAIRDVKEASVNVDLTRTEVDFIDFSDSIVDWYISSGEWKARAGAYAIQGKGAALVREVRGCFTNVIGISVPAFLKILAPYT